jgi:ribosomal protein S18 acetylase RimI-like enzyme
MPKQFHIRPYQNDDLQAVVGVWHRSGIATYIYLPTWQAFTFDEALHVFQNHILTRCAIWLGVEGEKVVAFLAMKDAYIDRLYVEPTEFRKGWGTQLIQFAKKRSPTKLELHTHVENTPARAFYEKHGFVAVKFGISPPPELAPDVEYHWRPI